MITGLAGPAAAQVAPAVDSAAVGQAMHQAAATITPEALARWDTALAADSLRDRITPSPALERTAQYVAAQFGRLGLQPVERNVRDTTLRWRYPIPGHLMLDRARSRVYGWLALTSAGQPVLDETGEAVEQQLTASFATAAYFAPEVGPPRLAEPLLKSMWDAVWNGSQQTILVAGPHTTATLPLARLQDHVVLYLPSPAVDSASRRAVLAQLYAASAGVLIVSDQDTAAFVAAQQRAAARSVPVVEATMREAEGVQRWPWAVVVRPETVRGLLGAAGLDLAPLRAAATPVLRDLPRMGLWLEPAVDTMGPRQTAPVVAGMLAGTDPRLKDQYLVLLTSLDAAAPAGRAAGRAGDRGVGREDPASGLTGLLALAQAFSQPGARPRHSVVFLATSGTTNGQALWGSNAYVDLRHGGIASQHLMGVLSLDRLDPVAAGDSLWIAGLQDVEFTPPPTWVAAMHPELGMGVADGGTVLRPTAAPFPFVRLGIPSLAVYGNARLDSLDARDDAHQPAAAPAASGARRVRALQFVFYLSETLANADAPPRWTAAGHRRLQALLEP